MGQLRITYRPVTDPPQGQGRRKKAKQERPGHCKACGAKLTDPTSLQCGYGRECFSKRVIIVLEMIPDAESA